ncbi:hypothetical protein L486_01026 [Kwoniella mangroviensis CBS 10435]|uniref:Uncharacterized protein n=1 Tax=Kwoniella mangroviensis CBS 10435 TaxID=1331196 RepID=A0A1B9J0S6_9TREE|nr:hypothetical protein L486_01026 [Kwoniella mangroviensis CBS 10435]
MSDDTNNNNDAPPHTTIDDCDVNWQYMGDTWGTNHTDDPLVGEYHHGTFTSTTIHRASARLCWTGTNAEILGAKRKNHALYTVTVDNGEIQWLNGYSEKAQIQATLYKTEGLEWGNHQITLTSMPKTNMTAKDHIWFDIDYAEIDGWPIDCKDLPENTILPPTGMITPAPSTTYPISNSNSTSTSANSNETGTGNSKSSTISSFRTNSTATLTEAPIATSNGIATLANSTAVISPTTTIIMSSPSSSVQASGVSSSSTTTASGVSSLAHSPRSNWIHCQLALIGMMGFYIFKWIF